ncbi:hypothetical protein GCM10025880_45250 [Methylorubrum aminovorans]|uniref:autotransporter-associated beta strand repeat-containing protein n=1 Tax=Methylorubrum aminovorans TaxID=269069 RepID=UPI0023E9A3D5|nr:autotransporter-associated beta strand repeat-containing protein [Methylorubrum aminovorans]GMA78108.1 hypothetical protein GCM10025880_45250 [Methylorubrum aminovorans]
MTVAGTQAVQGLQFTSDGYRLAGPGALLLTGDPFSTPSQSFVTVDAGVSATIATGLTGGAAGIGLRKLGSGTLTLAGAGSYTGATTVEAGTLALAAGGSLAGPMATGAGAASPMPERSTAASPMPASPATTAPSMAPSPTTAASSIAVPPGR